MDDFRLFSACIWSFILAITFKNILLKLLADDSSKIQFLISICYCKNLFIGPLRNPISLILHNFTR